MEPVLNAPSDQTATRSESEEGTRKLYGEGVHYIVSLSRFES